MAVFGEGVVARDRAAGTAGDLALDFDLLTLLDYAGGLSAESALDPAVGVARAVDFDPRVGAGVDSPFDAVDLARGADLGAGDVVLEPDGVVSGFLGDAIGDAVGGVSRSAAGGQFLGVQRLVNDAARRVAATAAVASGAGIVFRMVMFASFRF